MLIKDKLRFRKDFTPVETKIAEYILKNELEIENYSTREIAKATFTSPSAVIRLCHKLGFDGFSDFKKRFLEETKYLSSGEKVDVNFPFKKQDTVRQVIGEIGDLYQNTLKDTQSLLDPITMMHCRDLIEKAGTIYIYSFGTYLTQAYSFKEKMMKVGKKVVISDVLNYQLYEAQCMNKHDLAIIISYSGETKKCLKIADICKDRDIKVISITSLGENSLSKLSNEVINISTKETLYQNIADYSIHISVIFILDLLYSIVFQNNFDKYYERKVSLAKELEDKRTSQNSLINKTVF